MFRPLPDPCHKQMVSPLIELVMEAILPVGTG
jgi:hypothetical protein